MSNPVVLYSQVCSRTNRQYHANNRLKLSNVELKKQNDQSFDETFYGDDNYGNQRYTNRHLNRDKVRLYLRNKLSPYKTVKKSEVRIFANLSENNKDQNNGGHSSTPIPRRSKSQIPKCNVKKRVLNQTFEVQQKENLNDNLIESKNQTQDDEQLLKNVNFNREKIGDNKQHNHHNNQEEKKCLIRKKKTSEPNTSSCIQEANIGENDEELPDQLSILLYSTPPTAETERVKRNLRDLLILLNLQSSNYKVTNDAILVMIKYKWMFDMYPCPNRLAMSQIQVPATSEKWTMPTARNYFMNLVDQQVSNQLRKNRRRTYMDANCITEENIVNITKEMMDRIMYDMYINFAQPILNAEQAERNQFLSEREKRRAFVQQSNTKPLDNNETK